MNVKDSFYGKVEENDLILDENEVALRLRAERGYTNDIIKKCEKRLRENVVCRYSAIRTPVSYDCENMVDFGCFKTESKDLYRTLKGSSEVFIIAVTLGIEVDRLLNRLSVISPAEHYITDALASALTESLCDYSQKQIARGTILRPRFSPGYGDLTLDIQGKVLDSVSAEKLLGITLSESLLMTPQKSITAIIGIAKS